MLFQRSVCLNKNTGLYFCFVWAPGRPLRKSVSAHTLTVEILQFSLERHKVFKADSASVIK